MCYKKAEHKFYLIIAMGLSLQNVFRFFIFHQNCFLCKQFLTLITMGKIRLVYLNLQLIKKLLP
jgi:hypothetical protein